MAKLRDWHRCPPAQAQACFGKAVASGLLAGVGIALLGSVVLPVWISTGLLLLGLLGWVCLGRLRGFAALLVGAGWAGLHLVWGLSAQLPPVMESREFLLDGVVSSLPQHELRRTRFQFRVDAAGDMPEALRGRMLQVNWYDDFGATRAGPRLQLRAGERWRLQLRLRAPRGLVNPGGFDAERHALAQDIVAVAMVRPQPSPQRLAGARGMGAWREAMASRIAQAVASPSARYVQALALGDTRGLQERDWQVLRATGLTHLIAISGFHVGMVAVVAAWLIAALWWLLPRWARRLPRPQAMALGALMGATVYAAVAGFGLPTVRTVLMVAVVVVARLGRRPLAVLDCLSLAALLVLLVDPLSILAAGFWLSFAGVAWLAWCLPERGHWLGGFLSAQRVATIGLLPLTALLFGQASLVGPAANLVAIPWWSLVVVPLAILGTGLEAVCTGAGAWAWHCAAWCFDLLWPLFESLGAADLSMWWLAEPAWLAMPLALLGAFWMLLPVGVPGKLLALLLWLPLLWPWREAAGEGEFEVVMLDVGQGLALLVRTRSHTLLYDAGPAVQDGFDAGERVVVPALRALAVRQLDVMVLSHADHDHAGGAAAVRAVVPIQHTLAPPGAPLPQAQACEAGQAWQWDDVRFTFLHPGGHFPYLRNESSCVLRIEGAHGSALLAGDIGEVVEGSLLKRLPAQLQADVVVVAHHGSGGSSSADFVAATSARLALVSAGHGNRFGHPRAAVVRRWQGAGAEVLNSADSGAVRVWLGRAGLQLREFRIWRARAWDAAERARAAAILSDIEQAAVEPEG